MKWFKRFLAISSLLVIVAIAAGGGWIYSLYQTPTQNQVEQIVDIPRGTSFRAATRMLANEGIYPHADFLYYWARVTDQTTLQAGEYSIPPQQTLPDLLALLASGRTVQYRVTLVEGWHFSQWRDALGRLDNIEHRLPDMTDDEVAEFLGLEEDHPEGWLYPETYSYTRGATDLSILRQAHERMQRVLTEEWAARSDGAVVETPYEALILASIIERETGATWEREDIAGVFTRRLQRGMRLQTDPTVIYGMGDSYDGRIRRSDLETSTPWNTYRISGLPPTPIAMPGRGSIHAALNPAPGSALYFVARGDGTHHFSDTLIEHNAAVQRYQLQRREDYRSAPPTTLPEEGS